MTQFLNVRKNDLNLHHTQTKFLLGSDPVVKKMSWPVLKKCHDRMWQKRKPGSENNRSDSVRLDENFWKKKLYNIFYRCSSFFWQTHWKFPRCTVRGVRWFETSPFSVWNILGHVKRNLFGFSFQYLRLLRDANQFVFLTSWVKRKEGSRWKRKRVDGREREYMEEEEKMKREWVEGERKDGW